MLNFDVQRFLNVTKGATGLRRKIEDIADEITEKGYKNIFLIGSGGSVAIMYPFEYILNSNSNIEVHAKIAAELILMDHKHLNKDSIAIFSSLSGTTKETVAAAKYCKEKGVTTISLVGELDTPLAKVSDYVLVNYAENDNASDSIYIQLYLLIFRLMNKRGEFDKYDEFASQIEKMPEILIQVKEATENKAEAFANKYKDEAYHMVVASGNLWGEAYSYAMCVLEEMQWIHAKSIHSAEFFHGTLEMVDENTSIIIMKGEDETRPLTERVEKFVNKVSKKVSIFDTKKYELTGINEEFRKYLSPIVIASLFERISIHLEDKRKHPLSLRKYYRKVEY
ncbi:SIS domain-containing protein [Clostridium neuense]|uniref:SIS domain-containing protein n=1 Tax=Clostridium neuense TaxID=1728934 RepID=A0ABW8TDX4_9CLOT